MEIEKKNVKKFISIISKTVQHFFSKKINFVDVLTLRDSFFQANFSRTPNIK